MAFRSKGEGEGETPVSAGPERVAEEERVEARGGEARAVTHERERTERAAWRERGKKEGERDRERERERERERSLTVNPHGKAVAPISSVSCETVHLSHTAVFSPGTARVEPMAHAQSMPSPMRQCWLLAVEPCCFEGVATMRWRVSLEYRALPTPTHHQSCPPPPITGRAQPHPPSPAVPPTTPSSPPPPAARPWPAPCPRS